MLLESECCRACLGRVGGGLTLVKPQPGSRCAQRGWWPGLTCRKKYQVKAAIWALLH